MKAAGVISLIAPGHTGSERVAQKLGARAERTLRVHDMDVTLWRYA